MRALFAGFLALSILLQFTAGAGPVAAADGAAGSGSGATSEAAGLAAGDSLSLEAIVRLAVQDHPAVEQAQAATEAAEAQIGVARSAFSPVISLEGSYARLDPVSFMDLPGGAQTDLFPHNNYDLHLGAGARLYDFGRREEAVHLAEAGAATARDAIEVARWNLAYAAVALFNQILILRENVALLDEQIRTLEEHSRFSQKKLDTGSATKLDVLTTSVRVAGARSARLDAAVAMEKQTIVLRQLTGLPAEKPLLPRGRLAAQAAGLAPDSLLAAAMRARPELRAAEDAESSAAVAVRLAALGDRPSLGAGLATGVKNGYFPGLDTWKLNLAGSLQLEVPLFDGHRTSFLVESARANLQAARARRAELQRRITAEVEQAVAGARASAEKLENATVQVERAEEALAMAKLQYGAGTATNLDLLDAETSLSEARLLYLRAQYDCVSDHSALDRATGRKIW